MYKNINIVSYGEVLFDVFGTEKKIGGAPLNLALRVASYGLPVAMISAIGDDEEGKVILKYAKENHLETAAIITTPDYDTGIVQVSLNDRGSATYEIKFPSAWDFIIANEEVKGIIKKADVFFYGSLICRNDTSKKTLLSLLESNNKMFKIFDVNLRKPFYSIDLIKELMNNADFIKFNDEEILEIASEMGFKSEDLEENIKFISQKMGVQNVCVTLGKHGSILLWKNKFYKHGGYTVKVADTVGAGDSFLASLTSKLMTGSTPNEALDFASAVGAMVASSPGANPKISAEEIDQFMKQ